MIGNTSYSSTLGKRSTDEWLGKFTVLYFYPKDDTPGCTLESIAFTKHQPEFAAINTQVIGVSCDTLESHTKFCRKFSLTHELISDEHNVLCNIFATIGEKTLFGKKSIGIIRSTFLLDPSNKIVHEWRNIRVNNHVENVLRYAQSIQAQQP